MFCDTIKGTNVTCTTITATNANHPFTGAHLSITKEQYNNINDGDDVMIMMIM